MKRKSPISVDLIQFYTFERYEDEHTTFFIDQFPYDDRRDFAVEEHLAGIAVKLEISNNRYDMGVRRNVELSLVDLTSRYEIAQRKEKVNIRKDMFIRNIYVNFPIETTPLKGGHTYRLTVKDATSSVMLTETIFHLFDINELGHPTRWYEIIDAGVKPAWESNVYKVLRTFDGHDYYLRFNLSPKFATPPAVLPELEMRLYHPDGQHVTVQIKEPNCFGIENFRNNIWTVDYLFQTSHHSNGVFYAELLCMDYPLAGFVFHTEKENTSGVWFGPEIKPLDEYTPQAALERLNTLLPFMDYSPNGNTDKDFENKLQNFIHTPD